MARITLKDVKTNLGISQIYDLVNSIRNSASDNFQKYVPLASAENVLEVAHGLQTHQTLQNEFVVSLIERISMVVIRNKTLKNQLSKFKKGQMPYGRTIQDIFVDVAKGSKFNPHEAETSLYKREFPNVHVLYHERNRRDKYKVTISEEDLMSAFTSWNTLGNFVTGIMNSLYKKAEADEYAYMMMLLDNYYANGLYKIVPVNKPNTITATTEFVKRLRATAKKMTLSNGSRDYNSLGVLTYSDIDDLHLFIDADLEAELDVDILAKAFNMDRTQFLGHVTTIDGFASEGLEAVMVDQEFFMVYDNLFKMVSTPNQEGLYWNYVLHVWQTHSVSRFANAVAFVSGKVPPVNQVIIDPAILMIRQNSDYKYTTYIRANDGKDHTITWDVKASTDTTLENGTIITDGLLKISPNQTGQLKVTATVSYTDDDGQEIDVIGESLVTVIS